MEPDEADTATDGAVSKDETGPVITATGLTLRGEHGPLYSDVNLRIGQGFHVVRLPGGAGQQTLLLTVAGRMRATRGDLTVMGDSRPRAIRGHCAIAAFDAVDELDEAVTVRTVLSEQRRWLAPFFSRMHDDGFDQLDKVFGDMHPPAPGTFIVELSDLELFLLRITLAVMSNRPILVVGDLEQVRDNERRSIAAARLGELATGCTVVLGATNLLGPDAPDHELHDQRVLTGGD
ncbi:hypothetical protein OOK62_25280 [Mycolicibacterium sp. J2]|nr:hypothetical protein [Mycolicibacterium sp. J2]MCX2715364.1 hypothetical protein [Mycolicibacterium sp. J2]